MNPNLTTPLILVLIFISGFQLKAQETDTARAETILKQENPYKKNRTKWLNENRFNTSTYAWNDSAINLNIEKAIKRRSTSNIVGFTGGGILVLGLLANIVGSVVHDIGDHDLGEEYQVIKGPYYLGGIMIASSVALSFDSLGKLKKAKRAREVKYAKK